jgi:hypothetical protein
VRVLCVASVYVAGVLSWQRLAPTPALHLARVPSASTHECVCECSPQQPALGCVGVGVCLCPCDSGQLLLYDGGEATAAPTVVAEAAVEAAHLVTRPTPGTYQGASADCTLLLQAPSGGALAPFSSQAQLRVRLALSLPGSAANVVPGSVATVTAGDVVTGPAMLAGGGAEGGAGGCARR